MGYKKHVIVWFGLFLVVLFGCSSDGAKSEQVEEVGPIEAEMTIDTTKDNGLLTIHGTTNLPDGGVVMVTLQDREGYRVQTTSPIVDGTFTAEVYAAIGSEFSGEYTVIATLSVTANQPQEFVNEVGEDYENIGGELMEEGEYGRTISYEEQITVE
ncbi:hypothetical protein N781_13505 [Pontibacillus halophilus JSM 076056 = DSM 19796]|uniref:Uncharacterized protein n=1 Tax=Pontibacillus halophilus JSM 076056 = DSM 19796 TaxID=1385510 RepID=A0A0A5GII2_9BACI|nr:hypothetical protein [Pontibacillus halophilus]KGX93046.1 hypothetical protein N781_13505 [Pontibacillus halophilus JSM 076056 = DSM 19796]